MGRPKADWHSETRPFKHSVAERLAAANEYLDKYGHLLPSELTEGSAARIRANPPKVLREHARLAQRFGRIGRI